MHVRCRSPCSIRSLPLIYKSAAALRPTYKSVLRPPVSVRRSRGSASATMSSRLLLLFAVTRAYVEVTSVQHARWRHNVLAAGLRRAPACLRGYSRHNYHSHLLVAARDKQTCMIRGLRHGVVFRRTYLTSITYNRHCLLTCVFNDRFSGAGRAIVCLYFICFLTITFESEITFN